MKNTKLIYWIITGLFAAFMAFSAYPEIVNNADAQKIMGALKYPDYFTRFIGWAKLLGVIAILVPGRNTLKEWAYAGLFFDLVGAVYSIVMCGLLNAQMAIMVVPFAFLFISYSLNKKVYAA